MFPVIVGYTTVLVAAAIGILSNRKVKTPRQRSYSIAVVAKNEEQHLPFLLHSLARIDYPSELFEVILVDDISTDSTLSIMQAMAKSYPNVTVISIAEKKLPGKKEGLQAALSRASKELLLLTDADCTVAPDWLEHHNLFFDEQTAMVVGYAPEDFLQTASGESFGGFSRTFRRFISLVAAGIYAATIGLNIPFSCAGRNLAVSRKFLLAAGGYQSLHQHTSGDDKQLLNLIVKNRGKVRYNSLRSVTTLPEKNSFHQQQKRRFGKLKMSSPLHLPVTLLLILFFLYLPVWLIVNRDIASFLLFYTVTLTVWLVNLGKHRERFYLADLLFIPIYPYYFIYYTILGTFGKWKWK